MAGHHASRLWIGLWTALTLVGCGSEGEPNEPSVNLEEFQVNTSAFDSESPFRDVAVGAGGQFMVGWYVTKHVPGGGFTTTTRIVAQRVDTDGRKAGAELAVAGPFDDLYFGTFPSLGLGSRGEAIFTYARIGQGILARRFQPDGTPAGPEFSIDSSPHRFLSGHSIAVGSTGESVVAWATNDGSAVGWTVRGQRLAADGSKAGSQMVLATTDAYGTQVEMAPDGSFLVTWAHGGGRRGQRYTASGSKAGPQLAFPDDLGGYGNASAVAMGPGGQIFFARTVADPDPRVLMQRYAADGSKLGSEVQVNTEGAGSLGGVSVAPDGSFAIVWEHVAASGYPDSILLQRFAADGSRSGGIITVATGSAGRPGFSTVTAAPGGRLLVSWVHFPSPAGGPPADSIRARLFAE